MEALKITYTPSKKDLERYYLIRAARSYLYFLYLAVVFFVSLSYWVGKSGGYSVDDWLVRLLALALLAILPFGFILGFAGYKYDSQRKYGSVEIVFQAEGIEIHHKDGWVLFKWFGFTRVEKWKNALMLHGRDNLFLSLRNYSQEQRGSILRIIDVAPIGQTGTYS